MLDLKAWIAKVTDYVNNNIYIVDTVTVNFSFSNQRYKHITGDVSKTGYTPVGFVGYSFAQVDWILSQLYLNGTTAEINIFRTASTTASTSIKLYVLYRKE